MKVKNQYLKYSHIYIWVSINDHPYSIHSGYLLFFETTIMEKTADLASDPEDEHWRLPHRG